MSDRNRLKGVAGSLLQMTVVAVAAIGAYHGIMSKDADARPAASIQAIVVVDTQALVQGKIDQASEQIASGQTFTQDQLTMQGQNFGTEMLRALKEYRDRGVLVIDRTARAGDTSRRRRHGECGGAVGGESQAVARPVQRAVA